MMKDLFTRSWARAWSGLGAHGTYETLRDALLAAYEQPQRRYHNLQHLEECLLGFEASSELAEHPAEVEIALWFHDAIYDVKGSRNERHSADWAAEALEDAGVDIEAIQRVHTLIMATRHSALPKTTDEKLLVDIDLSILGASRERFDEYQAQIRAEYAFVPELLFTIKRREILCCLLARERIYSTDKFFASHEDRARANLVATVA